MEELETVVSSALREDRERIFEKWYEQAFPYVAKFVSKMGGSFEDAKDIFHDALVIFYEKTLHEDITINISEEAYILGISKHLWIRKFNRDRDKVSLEEGEISIPNDYFPDVNSSRLLNVLESSGKKCLELLRAFYYEKLSLSDIAHSFDYLNIRSATVQKYKCLEKVRDTIKEKSITYEDFIE